MTNLLDVLSQALEAESPREMYDLVREAHAALVQATERRGDAPAGWLWVETATPGEVRMMRQGSGWPTLMLRGDQLTVLSGTVQEFTISTHALEALLGSAPPEPVPPLPPEILDGLSPGIRDLVVDLRAAGFNTCDSGDGSNYEDGMECAVPFRMIAIVVSIERLASETARLAEWCRARPLDWPAYQIEGSWNPAESTPLILLTEASDEALDDVERITGRRPTGMF